MTDNDTIIEPNVEELLLSYKAMEAELIETKEKLEALQNSIDKQHKLSSELKELLTTPIDRKDFSVRVFNVFSKASIVIIFDLIQYSRADFLKYRNSGKKCADEVEAFLKSKGLSWKTQIETTYRIVPSIVWEEECI
jgi:DNA-directed RNA polymerase alpha subunit